MRDSNQNKYIDFLIVRNSYSCRFNFHELYNGVIAAVPFVDVITTMLDETIPLTTSEYDEWGNPNQKQYYNYMMSYSPYDNVSKVNYPNLLVTTGLHDSQVQYWEPAKWVAKLRD